MLIKFGSWNRVTPPHEFLVNANNEIQCSVLQNYIYRDKHIKKTRGTAAYNLTALENKIPWVKRSYHLRGDNSVTKKTFCFSNGIIYYGDDALGTLTQTKSGLFQGALPTDMTIQVAENSILFLFPGEGKPVKYDGNGSFQWEDTVLDVDIVMGVEHLERAFYIKKNSSYLDYSETLLPESIEDTILIGNDKNGVNMAMIKGADDSFFIFKNNSIYQLLGRTPSTFQVRRVTDKYGLASKRGICAVGSGFVFLNEFDKELYFFSGSEQSIRSLTEKEIRLREILNLTEDALKNVCMTVHNGLFRFAFQYVDSFYDYNNCELVYPIAEPQESGLPHWSLIEGTNVLSYSVWNEQGDKNELVSGRSDVGKLMYHNRGVDFDNNAIETQVRTGEVIASEDMVGRFNGFFIKGKPGSANKTVTFRYFLNGRFSDRGEHNLSTKGETRTIGTVILQMSNLFNDRIRPFVNYSRGNSISFELYDFQNGTDLELYSISFGFNPLYKLRNQYV